MTKCSDKLFKIPGEKIIDLIHTSIGCIATDKITVDGLSVGYMYIEEPDNKTDSGWRFFSGTEDQDYVDDPDNLCVYAVNTIANYDRDIIPYLGLPIGTALERNSKNIFAIIKD